MDASIALADMVIRPGQTVKGSGFLVLPDVGASALVSQPITRSLSSLELPADASCLPLEWRDPDVALRYAAMRGEEVAAVGIWTGSHIAVTEIERREASQRPERPPGSKGQARADSNKVTPAAAAIEGPLFDAGLMLGRVITRRDDGSTIVTVSATDATRVEAALRPVYGDSLTVLQSRWSHRQVALLDQVLGAIEPKRVQSIAAYTLDTGQPLRHLSITYVDDHTAAQLNPFTPGLLRVNSMTVPLSA